MDTSKSDKGYGKLPRKKKKKLKKLSEQLGTPVATLPSPRKGYNV
jgi:hypothetical protein